MKHYNSTEFIRRSEFLSYIRKLESKIDSDYNASTGIQTEQPVDTGIWNDNGTLKFYNGSTNKIIDFSEGELLDAFGEEVGTDQ